MSELDLPVNCMLRCREYHCLVSVCWTRPHWLTAGTSRHLGYAILCLHLMATMMMRVGNQALRTAMTMGPVLTRALRGARQLALTLPPL